MRKLGTEVSSCGLRHAWETKGIIAIAPYFNLTFRLSKLQTPNILDLPASCTCNFCWSWTQEGKDATRASHSTDLLAFLETVSIAPRSSSGWYTAWGNLFNSKSPTWPTNMQTIVKSGWTLDKVAARVKVLDGRFVFMAGVLTCCSGDDLMVAHKSRMPVGIYRTL